MYLFTYESVTKPKVVISDPSEVTVRGAILLMSIVLYPFELLIVSIIYTCQVYIIETISNSNGYSDVFIS